MVAPVLLGGLFVDEGVEDLFRCRCDVGGVDVGGFTHFWGRSSLHFASSLSAWSGLVSNFLIQRS